MEFISNLQSISDRYDLFIVDIYGVIFDGRKIAKLALKALINVSKQHNKCLFFLSNSPRPSQVVRRRLAEYSKDLDANIQKFIKATPIFTSGDLFIDYMIKAALLERLSSGSAPALPEGNGTADTTAAAAFALHSYEPKITSGAAVPLSLNVANEGGPQHGIVRRLERGYGHYAAVMNGSYHLAHKSVAMLGKAAKIPILKEPNWRDNKIIQEIASFIRGKVIIISTMPSHHLISEMVRRFKRLDLPKINFTSNPNEADYMILLGFGEMNDPSGAEKWDDILEKLSRRNVPCLCPNPDIISPQGNKKIYTPGFYAERYRKLGANKFYYFGKPFPEFYDFAIQKFNYIKRRSSAFAFGENTANFILGKGKGNNRVLAIGDSLSHDILGAHNVAIDSLLITNNGIEREAIEQFKPNYVMDYLV